MEDSKQVDFIDGKLYRVMNFIYYMTMSSTLFLVSNILFLFAVYALLINSNGQPITIYHLLTIAVLAIPIGPALTGLYTVMNGVLAGSGVAVIKDYFQGYRRHFRASTAISSIIAFIFSLGVMNYLIINESPSLGVMLLPLLVMLSILLCITLYIFPLLVVRKLPVKELFKLSLYFVFREFKTTFYLLMIFLVSVYLILLIPTMLTFILPAVFCMGTSYFLKDVYKKISA